MNKKPVDPSEWCRPFRILGAILLFANRVVQLGNFVTESLERMLVKEDTPGMRREIRLTCSNKEIKRDSQPKIPIPPRPVRGFVTKGFPCTIERLLIQAPTLTFQPKT